LIGVKKVISKYNSNSARIIESNQIRRATLKEQFLEEKKELAAEMPMDDSVMEIVPNGVPLPSKRPVDAYSKEDFHRKLAEIRKGGGVREPVQFSSEFFKDQNEIRTDLQKQMK